MKKFLILLITMGVIAGVGVFIVGPGAVEDLLNRRLTGDGAADTAPGPTLKSDTSEHPDYISRVYTTYESNGGTVYHVVPTKAGRAAVGDDLEVAWQQAVAMGVPNTSSLYNQFKCHPLSVVARPKPSWDLEDWRPAVGLTKTMLAGCNPT